MFGYDFSFAGLFGILFLLAVATTLLALFFRRVVPTNAVHIVQSSRGTKSYGNDTTNGNTYYEIPTWVPRFGVAKTILPMSNFSVVLADYEAFDKGRLPLNVDVMAFFRVKDSNVAARRISNYSELQAQLHAILQSAIRCILANSDIETILSGRSLFGELFTKEVAPHLAEWGVETVKNIELMDIKDSKGSVVIKNITEKKRSHIEMESRIEVAKNMQDAEVSETNARRDVELNKQQASQSTGLRKIEVEQQVQISQQNSLQAVAERQKVTKEKEMEVLTIQHVKTAEINQMVAVVNAEQQRKTAIIEAEGTLSTKKLLAEGNFETTKRSADGITLEGIAKAAAQKAMLMAPVDAQTTLAKEIGTNEGYQKYLVTIKQVEANQAIGVAQAESLKTADIKIIANAGSPATGLTSAMDLFSSRGGTQMGAMIEGLVSSDAGKALVEKITGKLQ